MKSKFIIENVSKSFSQKILKNISLEISGEDITVVVGKSGCGKTTFLRMLAGLENISEGSIKFLDSSGKREKSQNRNGVSRAETYAVAYC